MKGKVWKFGDNIDTDMVIPGEYLSLTNMEDTLDKLGAEQGFVRGELKSLLEKVAETKDPVIAEKIVEDAKSRFGKVVNTLRDSRVQSGKLRRELSQRSGNNAEQSGRIFGRFRDQIPETRMGESSVFLYNNASRQLVGIVSSANADLDSTDRRILPNAEAHKDNFGKLASSLISRPTFQDNKTEGLQEVN